MAFDPFFDLRVLQFGVQQQQQERRRLIYDVRKDPFEELGDRQFKRHFRFDKPSVERIVHLIEDKLTFETEQGRPLSPSQQVCIALNSYASGSFQRIVGLCAGVSQNAARHAILRVTEGLCELKPDIIHLPSHRQMRETADRMEEKFHLPNFAFAVDGMMVRFDEAPRGLPPNRHAQQYWCRKQYHAINAQIVAGDTHLIYDIDCGWPGSTHDARIWRMSDVKIALEQQQQFLLAGDSGYPISTLLVKPFSTAESRADPRKALFNGRLSGLRTVMSECVFGIWKRRFPCLKHMRTHLQLSQDIIFATAVLHNLGVLWRDEAPEDEEDEEEDEEEEEEEEEELVIRRAENFNPMAVRLQGQLVRSNLLHAMP